MDHRWGARHEVALDVALLTPGDRLLFGRILNVSLSGALIFLGGPLPLLSVLRVRPLWGLHPGERATDLSAHVVRADAQRIGVEWWNMQPDIMRDWLCPQVHPHYLVAARKGLPEIHGRRARA